MQPRSIWIGWDRREAAAFEVARHSLLRHLSQPIPVHKLSMPELQQRGLYTRPTATEGNRLIDGLSIRDDYDGSISTEHANARFLVPHLAREGLALFMDSDVLVRADVAQAFDAFNPAWAAACVQHLHKPTETVKMDGQVQTNYARKNWSSFVIFNCDHEANRELTIERVNAWPGRWLHAFAWLSLEKIGALSHEWNYLVGWTALAPEIEPKVVHFTSGTPDMAGYEDCEYANEWRAELARCGRIVSAEQSA